MAGALLYRTILLSALVDDGGRHIAEGEIQFHLTENTLHVGVIPEAVLVLHESASGAKIGIHAG